MDDELIDLDQLHGTRRAFCLGAGAGLVVLAAGCGVEDPRISTGGIDTQPGGLAGGTNGNNTTGTNGSNTTGTNGSNTTGTNGSNTTGTNGTTTGTNGTTTGTNGSNTTGTNGSNTTGTNGTTTGTNGTTTGTNGGTTTSSGGTTGAPATCPSTMISAGSASAVAVGQAKRVTSGNKLDAWLCHDAGGYYALDNYCPHRGCPVQLQGSTGFYCNCHGATFDLDGTKTNRVSPRNMDHLSLCVDSSGNAYVDPNTTVSATTRV